jgi:hypothetical protein
MMTERIPYYVIETQIENFHYLLYGKRSQESLGPSARLGEPGEIGGLAREVALQSRDQPDVRTHSFAGE